MTVAATVHLKVILNVFCLCVCIFLSCVCACLCGQNARRVILGSSAVRPVSVRTEPGVTTSPGDAAVWPGGLESAASCVSGSSCSPHIS